MSYYYGIVYKKQKDELKHYKYIKRVKVGDKYRYYYDESKGGSSENKTAENSTEKTKTIQETQESKESSDGFDLDEMANKIIRGEFGNGEERKKLLGESYADVQKRVNQILLGENKTKEILDGKTKEETTKKTTNNTKQNKRITRDSRIYTA